MFCDKARAAKNVDKQAEPCVKEVLSLPKVCVIVSPDTSRLMNAKKADLAFINFNNVRSDADRDTTYIIAGKLYSCCGVIFDTVLCTAVLMYSR